MSGGEIMFNKGFIFVLYASTMVWAQVTSATLSGRVADEEGVPLGSVQVKVSHLDTGRTWSLLTSEEGKYLAPSLPVGSYLVEASLAGFKTALSGIHLKTARDEVILDLTLKPEAITGRVKGKEASAAPQGLQSREQIDEPAPVATNKTVSISPDTKMSPPPANQPPTSQFVSTSIKAVGFAVQIGAFQTRQRAEGFRTLLQDGGYTAYVVEADIAGLGRFNRVRVGPFDTL